MTLQEKVVTVFQEHFGDLPTFVVRAPGRVNLIGEHTDYNDGFVLPMAIDRAVWIALRPRDDGRVFVRSLEQPEPTDFVLGDIQHTDAGWAEYVKGMAVMLQNGGYELTGWEGVLSSDVPVGSGLSSSAALEMGGGCAFSVVSGFPFDRVEMARLGQKNENEWVGANTGIMDQLISAVGLADHAVLIDCRSLETRAVPLPPETAVVVLDTKSRRGLVDSAYNERRAQCEAAARFFGVSALRDVDLEQFQSRAGQLDELTRRRARHVITENARTLQAAEVMKRDDPVELGHLMNASHASLRDDFEVTNEALNTIVACACRQTGCYGARMTGAGFGGCAVALVQVETVQPFIAAVTDGYQTATGLAPAIYVCAATNGAEVVFKA